MSAISLYNARVFENMYSYKLQKANFHMDLVNKRIEEKLEKGIFDFRFPLTLEERKFLQGRKYFSEKD